MFTTTKNTPLAIESKSISDPEKKPINDPVVQKFLMPNQQVGMEASPTEGSIPSGVTELPKIGNGYWRIGIVDTLCTHGINDYATVEPGDPRQDVDYPVLSIYGAEGELNAKPQ